MVEVGLANRPTCDRLRPRMFRLVFFDGCALFRPGCQQFVKVEPNQCWLDVQDAVHRRAYGVITDERLHTLTIDRFASVDGTIAIVRRGSGRSE
jgi:hypothetical protein